jgi:hypothetical protein
MRLKTIKNIRFCMQSTNFRGIHTTQKLPKNSIKPQLIHKIPPQIQTTKTLPSLSNSRFCEKKHNKIAFGNFSHTKRFLIAACVTPRLIVR